MVTPPKCTCEDLKNCSTCYQRDWRRRNAEKVKASKRKWGRTRDRVGDSKSLEYSRLWRLRNPGPRPDARYKVRARQLLADAVRRGEVVKGPCVECGVSEVHGHHEDYSEPLEVIWLCSRHHAAVHRKK